MYARSAGQLTVGFENCTSVSGKENDLSSQTFDIPYSGEWQTYGMEGKWNGTGDFVLRYSGDCYIAIVTVTDEPLEEFSKTVSTQIVQTATNIKLLGENIDNVNGTTTRLGIDLDTVKKQITQYVGKAATKEELEENKKTLNKSIEEKLQAAKDYAKDTIGAGIRKDYDSTITTVKQNSDSWSVAAGGFDADGNLKSSTGAILTTNFARFFTEAFDAKEGVVQADISVFIKDEAGTLISYAKISADNIILEGHTMAFTGDQITINTNNFKLDKNGNVSVKGEINATSGSIGGFAINKYALGSVGQVAGMGLSNEYLSFMNQAYLHGEGYFITCGSYMDTGLRIDSTTSSSNDISTGILVNITAGTVTPSDPISGGKMCTALDLRTRWADQAGSFDTTNAYEGNHAIVIRGGDVIGLRPSYVRITVNYSLTEYNHTIECSNDNEITLSLPSSPKLGQCYTVIQRGGKVVLSSTSQILNIRDRSLSKTWYSDTKGQVSWFWYNGEQWIVTYATR